MQCAVILEKTALLKLKSTLPRRIPHDTPEEAVLSLKDLADFGSASGRCMILSVGSFRHSISCKLRAGFICCPCRRSLGKVHLDKKY